MEDLLYSGRLAEMRIGVTDAVTTRLVNEAVLRHDCDPYAAHILGRALTAALLASVSLHPGERLKVCWKYEGAVRICRGNRLQALPDTGLLVFDQIRRRRYGEPVRRLLARGAETDSRLENVVNSLCADLEDEPGLLFDEGPAPGSRCTCSREKMGAVVRKIPAGEREKILREKQPLIVHCHFCNRRFVLTQDGCSRVWGREEE
jgi:molecular chaperone Hsp33